MERTEATADDSFAEIRECSKVGIAIAAMIRMIVTTISNSIREKPRCLFIASPGKTILPNVLGDSSRKEEHATCHRKSYLYPVSLLNQVARVLIVRKLAKK